MPSAQLSSAISPHHDCLDWSTPSLRAGWDLRDVLVHLAATATLSLPKFAAELALAGFLPQRITEKQIAAGRERPARHALDALGNAIYATATPPQPTITRVIEIIVHGEDIRRPLHIEHAYDPTHVGEALRTWHATTFSARRPSSRVYSSAQPMPTLPSETVSGWTAVRYRCCWRQPGGLQRSMS